MNKEEELKAVARVMSVLDSDEAFKEKIGDLFTHIEDVASAEDVDEEHWQVCARGVFAGLWLGALHGSMETLKVPLHEQRSLVLQWVDQAFEGMNKKASDEDEGGETPPT